VRGAQSAGFTVSELEDCQGGRLPGISQGRGQKWTDTCPAASMGNGHGIERPPESLEATDRDDGREGAEGAVTPIVLFLRGAKGGTGGEIFQAGYAAIGVC